MAGQLQKLTLATFGKWTRASDAIAALEGAYADRSTAADVLLDNLKAGTVRSGATRMGVGTGGSLADTVLEIAVQHWGLVKRGSDLGKLWQTNNLTLNSVSRDVMGNVMRAGSMIYLGVRFERLALNRLIADAPKKAVVPSSQTEEDPAEDGPPVDRKDLEAWHALYTKLYPGELPLPHAVASAKGFFRGKTVGRDRVHALFPARQSGRKAPTKK